MQIYCSHILWQHAITHTTLVFVVGHVSTCATTLAMDAIYIIYACILTVTNDTSYYQMTIIHVNNQFWHKYIVFLQFYVIPVSVPCVLLLQILIYYLSNFWLYLLSERIRVWKILFLFILFDVWAGEYLNRISLLALIRASTVRMLIDAHDASLKRSLIKYIMLITHCYC